MTAATMEELVREQLGQVMVAPLGLAACKGLVRLGVSDPRRAAHRLGEWRSVVFGSEDGTEGVMAFVGNRKPVWQGR